MIDSNKGADVERAQFRDVATSSVAEIQTAEEVEERVEAQVQLERKADTAVAATAISLDNEIVSRGILSMRQATRSVMGAVQYPGLYPVAGEVSVRLD